MRLGFISIRNYRPFRSVNLELPSGLVSIMGPNGSGKSSLMEAVAWALYGNQTEIVRTGKESIKREGSAPKDPCSVRIEFDFEGTTYIVERSMKGKSLTMAATMLAGDKLIARSSDDVTGAVEKLFGMDHKSFFVSIFARQNELNALTSHPKHMRKKMVLRMLEIENIDDAIKKLREDLRLTKSGIDMAQEELSAEDGKSRISLLEKELAIMEKEGTALDKAGAGMKKELDKVEEIHKKLKAEMDKLEKVKTKLNSWLRKKEALVATLKGLEEKKKELEKELARLEKLELNIKQNKSKMTKTEKELGSILDKKNSTLKERGSLRVKMGELQANQKQLNKDINEIQGNVKEISGLGPDSECPTCLRKLGETYVSLLKSFERQAREKETRLEKNKKDISGKEEKLVECEARFKALTKRENLLRGKLEDWKIELSRVERIGSIRSSLKSNDARIKKSSDDIKGLENEISSLKFDESAFRKARRSMDDVNDQIRKVEREFMGIKGEKGRLEERIENSKKEIERLKKLESQVAEKKKETEILGALEGVMDGFRKHLMSRIRPALAYISSELIDDLTNGKYSDIELTEDYDISIRDGAAHYNIERFSGGERDLANLCLRLAISEVIAEKHGSAGFGFIVLDEIFGSQDSERKRSLLATLNGLSNRFKQIFLITHVEDVKELMGNVIQVTETQDGTSIAEVM